MSSSFPKDGNSPCLFIPNLLNAPFQPAILSAWINMEDMRRNGCLRSCEVQLVLSADKWRLEQPWKDAGSAST